MRPTTLSLVALSLAAAPALLSAQAAPPAPPTTPATAAAAPAAPAAPAPPAYRHTYAEALELGRLVTERVYTKNIEALIESADPGAGTADSVRAKITPAFSQIEEQLGPELKVISERIMLVNGRVQYWRTAEYTAVPVPLVWRVILGDKGKWRGFTASTEESVPAGEEIKP